MTYTEDDLSDWIDGSVEPWKEGMWLCEIHTSGLHVARMWDGDQWLGGFPKLPSISLHEAIQRGWHAAAAKPRSANAPIRYRGLRFDPKAGA
jgi:hypothetical protein